MRQVGIRTRFTLILSLIFAVALIASWAIFSRVLQEQAQDEISYQALVLMEMLNSVRKYTNTEVNPLLAPALQTQDAFIPQSVPAFSAREVFENFRSISSQYAHFLYKEATLNPTNPRDLADDSEKAMVEQFRSDPSLKELSGYMMVNDRQVFYNARPLAIASENCLTCHGDPKDAPASQRATYGTENGYGWKMGEIIAAQTIYLPAQDVFGRAQQALNAVMSILVVIFALTIIVTNVGLRRAVVRPVVQIARLAQLIGSDRLTTDAPEVQTVNQIAKRNDEFGQTAKIIQRMVKEIYEREQKLKLTIESLRIQVDKEKQTKEVREITESDYFQSLQKQAGLIRERSDQRKQANEVKPVDNEKPS
ncbi:MAG: DUF3365 domain-containing protein [Chloroflexi bacterium]|nr:DUF3365 domain-containing protein [Chloroflexota bacterium]